MEEKKFIIELNEKQLNILKIALEEYFRIRLNQWGDLANDLAGMGVDFSQENPNHERIIDSYIERRDCVRYALESAGRMAFNNTGYTNLPKTEEQLIAEDMWQVFRYTLWNEYHKPGEDEWCVDSRKPMNYSGEPLPVCKRKVEDKENE